VGALAAPEVPAIDPDKRLAVIAGGPTGEPGRRVPAVMQVARVDRRPGRHGRVQAAALVPAATAELDGPQDIRGVASVQRELAAFPTTDALHAPLERQAHGAAMSTEIPGLLGPTMALLSAHVSLRLGTAGQLVHMAIALQGIVHHVGSTVIVHARTVATVQPGIVARVGSTAIVHARTVATVQPGIVARVGSTAIVHARIVATVRRATEILGVWTLIDRAQTVIDRVSVVAIARQVIARLAVLTVIVSGSTATAHAVTVRSARLVIVPRVASTQTVRVPTVIVRVSTVLLDRQEIGLLGIGLLGIGLLGIGRPVASTASVRVLTAQPVR